MGAVKILLAVLSTYAAFWAFYVVLLPILARLKPDATATATMLPRSAWPDVVVIVPAHNMEGHILRCVDAIRACDYPGDRLTVVVVADNCTDATTEQARSVGVMVLVRDEGPAGKTYTLAWALRALADHGIAPEMYVITDATARLEPGFLRALAFRMQLGHDIVVGHSVVDAANQQWFARCLGLTLVHRNLQNRARERLDLSSLIEGRGMAYSRAYIQRHGWSLALPTSLQPGSHPTEDWRHGVRAVEHGFRVAFADDARVMTPLRDNLAAATQQGVRWERGRMANAGSHAVRLLMLALRTRSRHMTFAALDAIQPPVAILAALCLMAAALTAVTTDVRLLLALGLAPLCLMLLYGIHVVAQGRRDGIPLATVAWAPVYVLWRSLAFVVAWASLDRFRITSGRK